MPNKIDITKFIDSLEKQYVPRANAAVARSILTFGYFVLDEAKIMTPVKKGNLVASGSCTASGEGSKLKVTIGFNTHYAAAVHEMLPGSSANGGPFHKPPTRSKFLSTAMQEAGPKFLPYVAAELDKEFAK